MKLSVKLLSGLTLIALVAVAVVGLSHSASAAVDAKVYVTNKASGLTSEPSTAVSGRTSASTVYGTYASSVTTGTTARDIVANSDRFIVTVIDADLNKTTSVTSNNAGGYDADRGTAADDVSQLTGSGFDTTDDSVLITIEDTKANPIIGSNSDITVVVHGTSRVVTGVSATIQYAGDGTNAPLIRLDVDYGTHHNDVKYNIYYPTSAVDITTATVKSVVDTGGTAVLTLTETGRNTGRFEGEVLVKERVSGFTAGLAGDGTSGDPAEIPAIGGPVTVTYTDAATSGTATNVSRTASVTIDTTVPTVSISSPATAAEMQERLPTFTGDLADAESGLDVSTFGLRIDDTNDAANAIRALDEAALATWQTGQGLSINVDGHDVALEPEDLEVVQEAAGNLIVKGEGAYTVALDPELDDELRAEGVARELVNRIQRLRKDAGLEITDRIELAISGPDSIRDAAVAHETFIGGETLAARVEVRDTVSEGDLEHVRSVDIDGTEVWIGLAAFAD